MSRSWKDISNTQKDNFKEWCDRMKEDRGLSWTDSIRIFNGLEAVQQQKIIRSLWYSRTTGKPIKRPLL
jgi:hypothetical protein